MFPIHSIVHTGDNRMQVLIKENEDLKVCVHACLQVHVVQIVCPRNM